METCGSANVEGYDSQAAANAKYRAKMLNKNMRKVDQIQSTKRALMEHLEKKYGAAAKDNKEASMRYLWKMFVHDRVDAEAFMEVMYPQLLKPVQLAYVDMFDRAVKGEIYLDEKLLDSGKVKDDVWDPVAEMEKERIAGMTNNAIKNMDNLMREVEEEDVVKYGKKKNTKKR